ncbi:taste receptor type 2 member 9-like [Hyla sarda]|uniref:taste receptor type 2 member 9-like n=1 Tax=Hyla sarda TaxID=327740 RepID=UPI0024C37251|nr:taste receptor type 2 member 9-like [Hyla sarda]
MAPEAHTIMIIALTIEFVVGIALNLHILFVHLGNLKNGLSLGPSDKIHLTKALVNISLHVAMTAQCLRHVFWPHVYLKYFFWVIIVITFLNFYSYWLTALLCVYYCTNITTCGHHIFVWLKRSLSSYLLHILLVSGLGSLTISIPEIWICSKKSASNSTYHCISIRGAFFENFAYKTISSMLGCFLPFAIVFVSTTFPSWSLLIHMWRMKQNNPGFTQSNFQTQINATRTMILFLLIFVICGVTQMFFIILRSNDSDGVMIAIWFIILSYPMSEAIVIIQSSAKLRNSLLEKFFDRSKRNGEAKT